MKNWCASLGVVASLLLAAVSRAEAQESKVRLSTNQPVYKVGTGSVTFTLKNEGTQPVQMGVAPWSIWRGSTQVRNAGPQILILVLLAPGQSKSWTWDKTDLGGKAVAAGTYTIKVGPLWIGNSSFTRSLDIALTPSGKIAGTSSFPLAVGNEWKYSAGPSSNQKTKVTAQWTNSSWYKVTNLVGYDQWAQLSGSDLWVIPHPMSMAPTSLLFRFNRPLGYTFTGGSKKWKVGATNETVVTPAGTFTGCYRLDFVLPTNAVLGAYYKSLLFAPGVGMVGYTHVTFEGTSVFRLKKLKLKGADGKVYIIGPNS